MLLCFLSYAGFCGYFHLMFSDYTFRLVFLDFENLKKIQDTILQTHNTFACEEIQSLAECITKPAVNSIVVI